ncbi:Glycosyltransferase, WecB/TagA/CpsF family [Desulfosarcina cetonica]|uniref:WecB/TagA/CpsF family glycosyltransferase n=1 Tax=Desulfosarcina cetonica TaxID=90730 RepID=UPI0006CF6E60|nr:WecB/TagA/CpsF family glycosyltransferase [Desulfosarcina cetonica]VTR65915.1 Glycosyltransferase, WecB/TagA/CpsF family [Desulfosarcina cetonica]
MQKQIVNERWIYAFPSSDDLVTYVGDKKHILIAIGTEKILNEDKKLVRIINENIGYPDGIGAVAALRRKGSRAVKIRGAELWLEIIRRYQHEKSFFLIGAEQMVIERTIEKLRCEFPNINILGYRDGYFQEDELPSLLVTLKAKKPDIVYVAMGSPRQEYIMEKMYREYPALYMGLGGSYDLFIGKAKPVPAWWNKMFKWEGLYRAFNDIGNLKRWKRQLPALRIIYKLLLNKI